MLGTRDQAGHFGIEARVQWGLGPVSGMQNILEDDAGVSGLHSGAGHAPGPGS